MPVYEYTALDRAGKNVTGIIDADSTVAARQKLRASGKYPVQVQETTSRAKSERAAGFSLPAFFNRVTPDDIHSLTRQLSTLLNAGIPLIGALEKKSSPRSKNLSTKAIASQTPLQSILNFFQIFISTWCGPEKHPVPLMLYWIGWPSLANTNRR
jgi:general secretion pathway protein F